MTENSDKDFSLLGFVVGAGALLIFCWGIWSVPILAHNEARRMVVVQEILRSGNWLVPTMNGEVYLAKPPLLYWLMALSCKAFNSQAEWAMRLPTSLMAVALMGIFLHRARRYLGLAPAVFGAAMLATSPDFIEYARTAQIEMLLALTCTLNVFWFLDYLKTNNRRWLYLSYAALGCAILTKGPVALVFFVPPALLFSLVSRDKAVLRALGSRKGWLIALAIALPWFLYIFAGHRALLDHVINEDMADKIAGVTRSSPLYTYPLFLLGTFAPWILVIFYRPLAQVKKIVTSYELRYFLIFALVPVLIMSLVSEKHGKYLLPILPILAMVLGAWCHELYSRYENAAPQKTRRLTFAAVGILLAGNFLFQVVVTPHLYSYRFSALKPLAAAIHERAKGKPVYALNELPIQLVYYVGQPLPVKKTKEIKELINAKESFLLVAESKTWQELTGLPLCLIEEFSPYIKSDRKAKLLGSGDFCSALDPGSQAKP
jgi:4-amino-4-deoxy-L-arabinose transferase-like glycosyltransferase